MSAVEDLIRSADTEEALIKGSRNSSEAFGERKVCRYRRKWAPLCHLVTSVVLLLWGVAIIVWTPFWLLMNERLRMTPGLPPYDWWKNPPDEVLLKTYIFNVTNAEEFIADGDVKLNMAEVGPITFLEKLTHTNVVFNENGTLTYVATRKAIFLPEMNTIDLNATIVVPNWALLGIASYLHDRSSIVKFGFNLLTMSVKPQQFKKMTIYQFLWNYTDPMLDAAQRVAPHLVPMKNLGILYRIYTNFTNTVTVYIGKKYNHQNYFLIDKYDGSDKLPYVGQVCQDKVVGSTEGVTYPQLLTKNTTIKYWRKTFTKLATLLYREEIYKFGLNAYRYDLVDTIYNRTQPKESDCFRGQPELPDGIVDISKCHFGFPLATSFPHFMYGKESIYSYVTGLKPNRTQHESYAIVEPLTGLPLESRARSQSNLVVRKLSGFNRLATRFSDTIIPMFWLEYGQVGLPWYIKGLLYFQVRVVPIFQWIFAALLFAGSALLFCVFVKHKGKQRLLDNKVSVFEREQFFRKP